MLLGKGFSASLVPAINGHQLGIWGRVERRSNFDIGMQSCRDDGPAKRHTITPSKRRVYEKNYHDDTRHWRDLDREVPRVYLAVSSTWRKANQARWYLYRRSASFSVRVRRRRISILSSRSASLTLLAMAFVRTRAINSSYISRSRCVKHSTACTTSSGKPAWRSWSNVQSVSSTTSCKIAAIISVSELIRSIMRSGCKIYGAPALSYWS